MSDNVEVGCRGSIADIGRLPVAREKEEGAEEEDDGRAGNTNGGFGRGACDLGDVGELDRGVIWEAMLSMLAGTTRRVSTILSGPTVAAIFPSRTAAPGAMNDSVRNG